jgi:hypothetical protein
MIGKKRKDKEEVRRRVSLAVIYSRKLVKKRGFCGCMAVTFVNCFDNMLQELRLSGSLSPISSSKIRHCSRANHFPQSSAEKPVNSMK